MAARKAFARRVIICDYNAPMLSVTGLLRMQGYVSMRLAQAAGLDFFTVAGLSPLVRLKSRPL
jgi:hypothetical protein